MESLNYAFEGKGLFLPDDTDLSIDTLVRNRTLLQKWDRVEGMKFISNQILENSGDETNDNNVSNSTITLNSSVEFSTRFSVFPNDKDSVFPQESNSKQSAKRARVTHLQSQIPSCQVYGCNKDLSDAKDYHKRHKVCNVHSKASLVVVNGIQQRFCQQCSRFHILAEFDEGKRSCRKRLAGHNERRRKPQFNAHFGSTVFTTDLLPNGSLFFSRILPDSYFPPQVNEPTNNITNIKFEPELSQISHSSINVFENRECPKTCLKTPLSLQDLSSCSNSSCALSLLSAEYYNSLPDSTGVSIATNQNFSTNFINPNIDFVHEARFSENGISQDLNGLNAKTVDLVELSLHLQRVEQLKYNAQVKLENGNVCNSLST